MVYEVCCWHCSPFVTSFVVRQEPCKVFQPKVTSIIARKQNKQKAYLVELLYLCI